MENITRHESFGKLQISRMSGGARNLYGSSIKHQDTIVLKIHKSSHERSLSSDYYLARGLPIVEVEMSQTQFAEVIASMNMGSGVPVTIKSINGEYMEECPYHNKIEEFNDEFQLKLEKIAKDMEILTARTKEIMTQKKAVSKAEKNEVLYGLAMLEQEIASNLSFINRQFSEQMDRTVLESKGEVEGFILNKMHTLGLKELQGQIGSGTEKPESILEIKD